jgi:hypothetical protein
MRCSQSTSNTAMQRRATAAMRRATAARDGISANAELVALRVRHHNVATGELLKGRCAGNRQPLGHLGYPCPPVLGITVGNPHIHMQPILGDLRFRHPLKEQPRPDTGRVTQPSAHVPLLLGNAVMSQPLLPGRERRRRRCVHVPQRQLPELRKALRVRAVERQVDLECHPKPPSLAGTTVRRRRNPRPEHGTVNLQSGQPRWVQISTLDFKIRVIGRWLLQHGASRHNPATVAVGFRADELHRANRKSAQPWETPDYPLLDLGRSRSQCQALIARAGLQIPRKSACWFCPFSRPGTWAAMRRDEQDLFDRAVALEQLLNDRRARLRCSASGHPAVVYVIDGYADAGDDAGMLGTETGHYRPVEPGLQRCGACGQRVTVTADGGWPAHPRGPVYLTRFGRPLDEAVAEARPSLFGPGSPEICDEGHCWT